MYKTISTIEELERALSSGVPEQRAEIMRRVTSLFLTAPASLTAEQIFLFDDIIQKLARYLEHQALAELGIRIATTQNVPPQLLRRCASADNIELAGPVLARSEQLTDQTLVNIAERKGVLYLGQIAKRRQLNEAVTDVLVDRGDRNVLATLAENYGARFSRLGMSTLAMRACGDDELISIIAQRDDIPLLIYKQLLSYATEQTRRHLLDMDSANSKAVGRTLNSVETRAKVTITARGAVAAQRIAESFRKDIERAKSDIIKFASNDRIIELAAALSVLSAISIDLIDLLICDESPFGEMVLCKAIGLDWSTTSTVLRAGPMTSSRLPQIEDMHVDFQRLSRSSAQRLIDCWRSSLSAQVS